MSGGCDVPEILASQAESGFIDATGCEHRSPQLPQTIGPGRGLEELIRALGRTRNRIRFSVRGSDFLRYSERLTALAAGYGKADALEFLPPAPSDEMARLAANYDVGLAIELDAPPNRAIALTNKIFVYLLAGLPVILSKTPAQQRIADERVGVARIAGQQRIVADREVGAENGREDVAQSERFQHQHRPPGQ